MISVTTPTNMVLGPGHLTYGGAEVGATKDTAKFKITRKSYSPELNEAGGPIKGTQNVIEEIPYLTVTLAEFELAKLKMAMANGTIVGDGTTTAKTLTSKVGRVPTAAYADAVFDVDPGDGKKITITIKNALADLDENIEASFGKEEEGAFEVTFKGHYDPATPQDAPYSLVKSLT